MRTRARKASGHIATSNQRRSLGVAHERIFTISKVSAATFPNSGVWSRRGRKGGLSSPGSNLQYGFVSTLYATEEGVSLPQSGLVTGRGMGPMSSQALKEGPGLPTWGEGAPGSDRSVRAAEGRDPPGTDELGRG